jgi:hypothetical protein
MKRTRRPRACSIVGVLSVALVVASAARAADGYPQRLIIADSSTHKVWEVVDLQADGRFDPQVEGEVREILDGLSAEPNVSSVLRMIVDAEGRIWALTGGSLDTLFRFRHVNDDPDFADAGEIQVVFDASADGPRLFTPSALARLSDGTFLIADPSTRARRIVAVRPESPDAPALASGESWVAFDSSNESGVVIDTPLALAVDAKDRVFVVDGALGVYLLDDADRSRDYLRSGEAKPWFTFREPFTLTSVDTILVTPDGTVFLVDETTGQIVAARDANSNGTANDDGEARVVLDATARPRVKDINHAAIDKNGCLVLLDGSADTMFLACDANSDGDFLDEGEIVRMLESSDVFATPAAIVLVEANSPPPPPTELFRRGDANLDDAIDISDPLTVLRYLFLGGADLPCADAADGDDSGTLNLSDPIYVLGYLFNGGLEPPPPFAGLGEDPTPDELRCPVTP